MSRVYQNGVESGIRYQWDLWGGVNPFGSVTETLTSGGCSLRKQSSHYFGDVYAILPTALGEWYQRDYLTLINNVGGSGFGRLHGWSHINAGLSCQMFTHLPNNDGNIHLYINGVDVDDCGGQVLFQDALHVVEYYCLVANSGGRFICRVDGVDVIDYTGDTQVDQTAYNYFLHWGYSDFGGPGVCHDEIAINNTSGSFNNSWVGNGSIAGYLPVAMGTGTNNLTGTPDATDRHLNVDEVYPVGNNDVCASEEIQTPSSADYNSTSTDGQYDLYSFDFSSVSGVRAVQIYARVTSPGAGAQARLVYKHNGVEYRTAPYAVCNTSAGFPANEEGQYLWFPLDSVPGTSAAWTPTDLATLEVGVECEGSNEIRVHQVLVEIDGENDLACVPPFVPGAWGWWSNTAGAIQ